MPTPDKYMACYWSGRDDDFDGEDLVEAIVEQVTSGTGLIRVLCERAAKLAIDKDLADPKEKRLWLKSNAEEIKELGGDEAKAWRLFTQGRVDALAAQLEIDVIEDIEEASEGEEPEEEPEPDEEDDEDPADEDPDDEPEPEPLPVAKARTTRPRK